MEKLKVVAFIPAKGGSRRLPKKNIKMLAGKPMLAWTIEACLKSKYIDRTFVSTEDKEIKEAALQYGAEVVDRPAKYSEGEININFAYMDFQYHLWEEKYRPNHVVLLLPTMPLRTARHIDEAYELMVKSESPRICSVNKSYCMPDNAYFINGSGRLKRFLKESERISVNRMFEESYDKNPFDLIYSINNVINIGVFNSIDYLNYSYAESVLPYVMSVEDAIDIDTPHDFAVAEMLLEKRIKEEKSNHGKIRNS